MSYVIQNIIVVGAGRNAGRPILEALVADGSFAVTILSRKTSTSAFAPQFKVHRVDESYPEMGFRAFQNRHAVVCAIGLPGSEAQKRMTDAAVKAGCQAIYSGGFWNNFEHLKVLELVPMCAGKEVLKYLQEKEGTGITWSAGLHRSFFRLGPKGSMLGYDLKARTATIYDSGNAFHDQLINISCSQLWESSNHYVLPFVHKLQRPSWPTHKAHRGLRFTS